MGQNSVKGTIHTSTPLDRDDDSAGGVTIHRLVLLGLSIPLVALGVVLWLLLPGGVAGTAYSPREYSQAVQVQPAEWSGRQVAVKGYITHMCVGTVQHENCSQWVLLDQPKNDSITVSMAVALGALQIEPQSESAVHAFLRHILTGLGRPFPEGLSIGNETTVTGTIKDALTSTGVPIFAPKGL